MSGEDIYIEPEEVWVEPEAAPETPPELPPIKIGSLTLPQGPDYHQFVKHTTPPPRLGRQVIAGTQDVKVEADEYIDETRINGRLVNPNSRLLPKG